MLFLIFRISMTIIDSSILRLPLVRVIGYMGLLVSLRFERICIVNIIAIGIVIMISLLESYLPFHAKMLVVLVSVPLDPVVEPFYACMPFP